MFNKLTIESVFMLSVETKQYIDNLKLTSIDKITRSMVEEGIKLLQNEINQIEDWISTPREIEAIQASLAKLQTREIFALTNSFISSSKKRHLTNIETISNMKDKLHETLTKLRVQAAERRGDEKLYKMQEQNSKIHHLIVQGLRQLDVSMNDFKYFSLLKFNAIDDKTTTSEIDMMHKEMILNTAKNDILRYVATILLYCEQVRAALPKMEGISQIDNPFHSVDLKADVLELNRLLGEIESKLNEQNENVLKKEMDMDALNAVAADVTKIHEKLDLTLIPIAEKVKQNMLTEKTGSFLTDHVSYDRPKEVLDEIGDHVKSLDTNKAEVKDKITRRAMALTQMHEKENKPLLAEQSKITPDLEKSKDSQTQKPKK